MSIVVVISKGGPLRFNSTHVINLIVTLTKGPIAYNLLNTNIEIKSGICLLRN